MTPLPINHLFSKPRPGDTAIVLGKGPSLDAYRPALNNGHYVMGINEVPCRCRCDGVVFHDSYMKYIRFADLDIIRPYLWRDKHDGRGYVYTRRTAPYHPLPHDDPAYELPWFGQGTLTVTVSILGQWGFRRLIMWGCDAFFSDAPERHGYAPSIAHIAVGDPVPVIYDRFRCNVIKALNHYGMTCMEGTL